MAGFWRSDKFRIRAESNTSVPTYVTDRLGLAYFHKSLYDWVVADFTESLELDSTLADA